ncbi:hypothetical protein QTP86_009626 [Hemibagrus guttatus]|nr:hypothetical protein QTP86_009626 [Hemibagrus guttatus]
MPDRLDRPKHIVSHPEQTVRRLRRGKQLSANTVYGGGGELLVSTGDIVGRWKEYFGDLLNPTDTPSVEEPETEDSEVDSIITQAEVTEVVQQLLGGKAPGVDEICPEYLKSLDVVGLSWLTRLCNIAWWSGTVPLDWVTGVVVPLFKKGDRRMMLSCWHLQAWTFQHALGRFAAECEAAGMRVSTSKSEAMVLDRKKGGLHPPEDRTKQYGFKQQSTRPTPRSGRNLSAGSRRASGSRSRSDITRCHFRKHHHRFFCAAVRQSHGPTSTLLWLGGGLQRVHPAMLPGPGDATTPAKSGWNEQALLAAYRQGLNPQVRLHLAAYEDVIGLERLIQLSIRVAARMQSCVDEPQDQSSHNTWRDRPAPVSSPEPAPEPMHLGTFHLTPAERQRRLTQNLCLYCGAPGHAIPTCPIRPPHPMVSTIFPVLPKMKPLTTHGTLTTTCASISVVALLDSGSAGNCISGTLCRQLGLRTKATVILYQIQSITGKPVNCRQVSHSAGPVLLQATSIESPFVNRPLEVPICYAPFSDVFCPKRASKLPPHRPWDCAIDLLPGEPVPRGRIYPLSIPEEKAMEDYIKEALAQGYIHPSTSPAASSFFFVAKKDGGLRPCIDYHALNRITVKFRSPASSHPSGPRTPPRFVLVYIDDILIYSRNLAEHRQHIAKVLECLRKFQLFLKAEKCSFHQPSVQFLGYKIDSNGIQMDEGKITAIRNWPAPTTVKELLTVPRPGLRLSEEAFNILKKAFTTAPLLIHPDPNKPFIVAVDASTTGVGAVLSQQQGNPSRLHQCAFFSRKLNPVERNYDIGNRELLAVKLALEEWRHWLEGAKHPFTVLTDHKNLEYLRAAKRLNP